MLRKVLARLTERKVLQSLDYGDNWFSPQSRWLLRRQWCNLHQRRSLAKSLRQIARDQSNLYHHEVVGVNSRLDTVQAAILLVKLDLLDDEINRRNQIAESYTGLLSKAGLKGTQLCQLGIRQRGRGIRFKSREMSAILLRERGIPTAVYYPLP